METDEFDRSFGDKRERLRDTLSINSEWLRAATHSHSGSLQFEVGIYTHGYSGPSLRLPGDLRNSCNLEFGLDIEYESKKLDLTTVDMEALPIPVPAAV